MSPPFRPASEPNAVKLVPPDPAWPRLAKAEIGRLAGVLGDNLLIVHHIGSTAIAGIRAKPTLDLMPIVRDLAALDAREAAVRALGYDWRGEFGLPGRRFLALSDAVTGERRVHAHAYQADSPAIDRHRAFRDYLRAHPDEAQAYEAEKIRAARARPDDSLAYNDLKSDWIKACETRALAWWRRN